MCRFILGVVLAGTLSFSANADDRLRIEWRDNYLTIRGDFPGDEIRIHYLEAYCRPGSTDREWGQTVIGHATELVSAADDGSKIELRDTLRDGVVVRHTITSETDEVDFRLVAHNPTQHDSQAHWAQPCIRVDRFTGCGKEDARALGARLREKVFPVPGWKTGSTAYQTLGPTGSICSRSSLLSGAC